jgi:ribosomal protein S27AE
MKNPTLIETIRILERYFSKMNEHFFENELSKPVITVTPDKTKKSLGWCTSWKAWKESGNTEAGYYEINICSDFLNHPIVEICETLLHEMVHLYNVQKNVKDCSRSGTYHNTRFRDAATAHGLLVEKDEKYGWCYTELNDEAKTFVQSFADSSINLYRTEGDKPQKSASKSRKYFCPNCGNSVRATSEVDIICAGCKIPYELEKK